MRPWFKKFIFIITVVLYFLLLGLWIAIPDSVVLNVSFSLIVFAFTLLVFYIEKERVIFWARSRFFSLLISSLITFFLLFAILAISNYVVYKHPKRLDLSDNQITSLTDYSAQVVKSLNAPVTFKIFSKRSQKEEIGTLLNLYKYYNSKIEVSFVDVDTNPLEVTNYAVSRVPSVIVEYKEKRRTVIEIDELGLTNALTALSRNQDLKVGYLFDHQEISFDSKEDGGLSGLKRQIEDLALTLSKVSLLENSDTLSNFASLLIVGPKVDFADSEIAKLDQYLKSGGHLLIALDPLFQNNDLLKFYSFLKKYGIIPRRDLVIDLDSSVSGSNGTVPIVKKFDESHAITKNFQGTPFFPLLRSFDRGESMMGVVRPLLFSSESSWSETSKKEIQTLKIKFDDADQKGPLPVALTFEEVTMDQEKKRARMVVIGNGSFVTNVYQSYPDNFIFLLNTLSWLTEDDLRTSFNLPVVNARPVFINRYQLGLIFYGLVIVIPLLLLLTALILFLRRRRGV